MPVRPPVYNEAHLETTPKVIGLSKPIAIGLVDNYIDSIEEELRDRVLVRLNASPRADWRVRINSRGLGSLAGNFGTNFIKRGNIIAYVNEVNGLIYNFWVIEYNISFLDDFRAVGGDAANVGIINDGAVAGYQKISPDNNHWLTGTQAGQAVNNHWRNHAEIRIVNGGNLEVNIGVGWNVYDFTVEGNSREVYVWRQTMAGVAAGPRDTALAIPADNALMDN